MNKNRITSLFKIAHPIIQAGMAGGPGSPELAAAVSNSGGLGTIGAGYMKPLELSRTIEKVKMLTKKPFSVNLFLPQAYEADPVIIQNMQNHLNTYRTQLGIQAKNTLTESPVSFEDQLEVIIEQKVTILSFTFNTPSRAFVEKLKERGIIIIGTATTVEEAAELEKNGVDAIVAQGFEAGGHRGTFLRTKQDPYIGTFALIPQISDAVKLPVIAAGGIMDGRGYLAAMALGASAVQLGTAFLASEESGAHPLHKEAALESKDTDTRLTNAFTGKWARGFANEYMAEMEGHTELPPYPLMHLMTSDIRKAAGVQGKKEWVSFWAGQGTAMAKRDSAENILLKMVREAEAALSQLKI